MALLNTHTIRVATIVRVPSKHGSVGLQGLGKTITALALILKTRGLEPALPDVEVCRRRDGSGRDVAFYTGEQATVQRAEPFIL